MPAISSSPDAALQREIDRRRGRFVPWVIAAFYVSFMSALIGFVIIAYQHPPSDVTAEAYEKGLDYNAAIDKGAAQAKLGWASALSVDKGALSFELRDAAGQGLDGAVVRAWFVHPGSSGLDRSVTLQPTGLGRYTARLSLPAAGQWEIHVTAEVKGQQYQLVQAMEID
ncbi:MAG: FixH family protein [Asticcacaulis sp.]|nr:FixH family protein [Asticcacaulis sp.]